ncbi:MAG: thiamine biosynthesis protein ThiS [Omnitrophica WOR_2 bacterium RIFCSPHIGHO2_02_FULL_68_15]|nr:MAG: thiamine biosynthesis protein ThiS [Omnitrophica WOR_2 bacterium RIFCSPHIGHO2_02_FULL_68_15]
MVITVNGEARQVPDGATVSDVLASFGVNPQLVAVEVNLDILRRGQYPETVLRSGDTVEIVQMVGGGA